MSKDFPIDQLKGNQGNGERLCPICGKTYLDHPALSRVDDQTEICPECGMAEALQGFAERPREQKCTIYQKLKEMDETERRNDERIKRFLADQQADSENNV